jgi:hypothetical protein
MPQQITVGSLLREYAANYISQNQVTKEQRSLIHLLSACRTGGLGSHFEQCDHCGYTEKSYNFPILGTGYAATATARNASKKTSWSGSINV